MKQLDDIPEGLPTNNRKLNEQKSWIDQLSHQVVDFCWTSPDQADVHVAAEAFSEAANDLPESALHNCVCYSGKLFIYFIYLFFIFSFPGT